MNLMIVFVAAMFVLAAIGIGWVSCHDAGDATEEMVSPAPDGPGPGGAPGVEQKGGQGQRGGAALGTCALLR